MDTMKAILERRSIRKYTDAPISEDQMTEILKAGMYAHLVAILSLGISL